MIEIVFGVLAIVAVLAGALSANYQLKQERKRTNDLAILDAQEQQLIDIESWIGLGFGERAIDMGKYNIDKSREAVMNRRNRVWPKKSRRKSSVFSSRKKWGSRPPKSRTVIRSMLPGKR